MTKIGKIPDKIQETINILVENGYFKKQQDIVNIALLEYFASKNMFEIAHQLKFKETVEGVSN